MAAHFFALHGKGALFKSFLLRMGRLYGNFAIVSITYAFDKNGFENLHLLKLYFQLCFRNKRKFPGRKVNEKLG